MRNLIITATLAISLAGCMGDGAPMPTPKFQNGAYVRSILGGLVGQVVGTMCSDSQHECYYTVRFVNGVADDRRLVTVEWMRDYELIGVMRSPGGE